MRILAVDDEKIALSGLVSAIRKVVPDDELISFKNPLEAIQAAKETQFDVAFLDVEMRQMSGIDLAKKLKKITPNINIIFTTGYMEYTATALSLHVSGYISKPVTKEKIRDELNELRNPIVEKKTKLRIKTFGNFEVYLGDKPLKFQNSKTKELFAYLIDRHGSLCTKQQIISVLWEDDMSEAGHISYMNKIRSDLLRTLEENNCNDVIESKRGVLGIIPEKIECDYYEWLKGNNQGMNAYRGEYMSQYSWGEVTHGMLEGENI